MTVRKLPVRPMATPLQTAEERGKVRGRAFKYGRRLLLTDVIIDGAIIGRAPFSHIDAETIAQKAWADGYLARVRDEQKKQT